MAFIDCQVASYTAEQVLVRQRDLCHRALQALNGLIRYTHGQRQGKKEYGDRALREAEIKYTISPEPPNTEFTNPEPPNPEPTNPEQGGL